MSRRLLSNNELLMLAEKNPNRAVSPCGCIYDLGVDPDPKIEDDKIAGVRTVTCEMCGTDWLIKFDPPVH